MPGLFHGTSLEQPITCEHCHKPLADCACPRTDSGKLLLPKDQHARVRREKRRGKHVTVITGLDSKAANLPALLKELRAALGAGGTITGPNDNELELQGDHQTKLVELLKSRGYPAKAAGG